ncbi:MAG TPA: cytochrome c maturation protein CcmE [Porticoccaceae bacterium]|nr:cytochrome c maturation protein CcmE [Porticoccaceae bacterium]
MKKARKQRLLLVIFIVVVASLGVGLVLYALRDNINLFYSPLQVQSGEAPFDTRIRVGGEVVTGSFSRASDSLIATFAVTDGAAQVPVQYQGILPDLFAEGEDAVAVGRWSREGVFEAEEVMAKHDEEYTPPEVAEAREQAEKVKAGADQSKRPDN